MSSIEVLSTLAPGVSQAERSLRASAGRAPRELTWEDIASELAAVPTPVATLAHAMYAGCRTSMRRAARLLADQLLQRAVGEIPDPLLIERLAMLATCHFLLPAQCPTCLGRATFQTADLRIDCPACQASGRQRLPLDLASDPIAGWERSWPAWRAFWEAGTDRLEEWHARLQERVERR